MKQPIKANTIGKSRRAVAPIIATLLMVAIAVVGGILIFVFTQGFFTDTQIGAPTLESLEIYGYDARDANSLTIHSGESLTLNAGQPDSILDDGDAFVLYVRNRGTSLVAIDSVRVYGEKFEIDTLAACSTTVPGNQKFLMIVGKDADANALADCALGAAIGPGDDGTILIRYEEDLNGEVKLGRPISVNVHTANGGVFSKQIQNGIRI